MHDFGDFYGMYFADEQPRTTEAERIRNYLRAYTEYYRQKGFRVGYTRNERQEQIALEVRYHLNTGELAEICGLDEAKFHFEAVWSLLENVRFVIDIDSLDCPSDLQRVHKSYDEALRAGRQCEVCRETSIFIVYFDHALESYHYCAGEGGCMDGVVVHNILEGRFRICLTFKFDIKPGGIRRRWRQMCCEQKNPTRS